MPTTITLKGVPDDIYERLKSSAAGNHRSLNSEVIACLEAHLLPRRTSALEHLAAIRVLRAQLPTSRFVHEDIGRLKRQGKRVIVVDANVIAYLLVPGRYTAAAEALLQSDSEWAVPSLWRSELRNVLATYVRTKKLSLADAAALFGRAAAVIGAEEYEVDTLTVLRLSEASGCSGCDCEFVALADHLDVAFVTADAKLVKAFPKRARLLAGA